jgi:hypothetical protein
MPKASSKSRVPLVAYVPVKIKELAQKIAPAHHRSLSHFMECAIIEKLERDENLAVDSHQEASPSHAKKNHEKIE